MVGTETILVTGGAGFIGSHTCVELLAQGYRVVALDSLINSHPEAIARIRRIAGGELAFVRGDACSLETLEQLFDAHRIDGVIHFAAHKAVGDSVRTPLAYYRNNLISLLNLLEVMRTRQVKTWCSVRPRRCMAIRPRCRWTRPRRFRQPTPMRRPSLPASGFWPIWPRPTRPGGLPRCGTSTRWARTRAA